MFYFIGTLEQIQVLWTKAIVSYFLSVESLSWSLFPVFRHFFGPKQSWKIRFKFTMTFTSGTTVDGPAKSCTTNLGWLKPKIMGCLPSINWWFRWPIHPQQYRWYVSASTSFTLAMPAWDPDRFSKWWNHRESPKIWLIMWHKSLLMDWPSSNNWVYDGLLVV